MYTIFINELFFLSQKTAAPTSYWAPHGISESVAAAVTVTVAVTAATHRGVNVDVHRVLLWKYV